MNERATPPAPPPKPEAAKPQPYVSPVQGRDREFRPAALEILETPPSPLPVATMLTICAVFAAALAWSYFGKLDVHAVASGKTTWHGYARHVIEFARAAGQSIKVPAQAIRAVPTSAFPTPARRPGNSQLATRKLQEAFGLALPPWQFGVERMLSEILT